MTKAIMIQGAGSNVGKSLVVAGLARALPMTLVVTFVLVPSTSTLIFKTFLCGNVVSVPGKGYQKYDTE